MVPLATSQSTAFASSLPAHCTIAARCPLREASDTMMSSLSFKSRDTSVQWLRPLTLPTTLTCVLYKLPTHLSTNKKRQPNTGNTNELLNGRVLSPGGRGIRNFVLLAHFAMIMSKLGCCLNLKNSGAKKSRASGKQRKLLAEVKGPVILFTKNLNLPYNFAPIYFIAIQNDTSHSVPPRPFLPSLFVFETYL